MSAELIAWLERPSSRHGLHFAGDADDWSHVAYDELARAVFGAGEHLQQLGAGPGERIALLLASELGFPAYFFATLCLGGTVVPLAPPLPFQRHEDYLPRLSALLGAAQPSVLVSDLAYGEIAKAAAHAAGVGCRIAPREQLRREQAIAMSVPELALLQFTSGSTQAPRAVRVASANLAANIAAIRGWLELGTSDATATWLPLHHDMGLIGCLLTPIVNQSDVWIMRPDQFIRHPFRWLERFGSGVANTTATPNLGLALAAARVAQADLERCDFSGWKTIILGSERIDPRGLQRFWQRTRGRGLPPSAFKPAYGMAEATLAVTGIHQREPRRAVAVERRSIALGARAAIVRDSDVFSEAPDDATSTVLSCGRPLAATSVAIAGERGEPLPDGVIGEICVSGPGVAAGYHGAGAAQSERFVGGQLRSGDIGFLDGGELFVIGRVGDSLKVRGVHLFAEELEAALHGLPRLNPSNSVVLLGEAASGRCVVVLAEQPAGEWADQALQRLLPFCDDETSLQVLAAPRGAIQRTTSGKPQRRPMWRAFQLGELPGELASVHHAADAHRAQEPIAREDPCN